MIFFIKVVAIFVNNDSNVIILIRYTSFHSPVTRAEVLGDELVLGFLHGGFVCSDLTEGCGVG